MGGLANESMFAIILQTFGEIDNPSRLINESATVADWSRMASPTSPYLFKESTNENINIICNLLKENKYTMFLRKVDKSFPDTTIKEIMNMDFNHTYELLHNSAISKKRRGENYNILLSLFGLFFGLGLLLVYYVYTKL